MATEREVALEVLPHFAAHVVAKRRHTYGYYSAQVGRRASESVVIGKAMHAIGVACVFARVPVAPLFYVERADHKWRGIFEKDGLERTGVLPFYNLLRVTAREYDYSNNDFSMVDKVLREVLPSLLPQVMLSPHDLWHLALSPMKDGTTFFSHAVTRYQKIFAALQ